MLDRLDLSRSGGLLGGPYLWFNYITRMIVQETAILILDYNRHAIPLDRLACSPESDPPRVSRLAGRTAEDRPVGDLAAGTRVARTMSSSISELPRWQRPTTGGDFRLLAGLTEVRNPPDGSPARDAGKPSLPRDGRVHRDRFPRRRPRSRRRDPVPVRASGRRAGAARSPAERPPGLPQLPAPRASPAARTINPFIFYETYLSGGRIVFLPLLVIGGRRPGSGRHRRAQQSTVSSARSSIPRSTRIAPSRRTPTGRPCRKIHRMRKPVFMGSLWLRARFDVEYLGLPLPSAPPGIAAHSLMESRPRFHRRLPPRPDHRRADP